MIQQLSAAGHIAWRVMSFPSMLLHEMTHYLLALPWSDESVVVIGEDGRAVHAVNWPDDVPEWAPMLSSLGPTVLGSLVGLIGLWRLLQTPPGTVNQWLLAGAVAAIWVIYVSPSDDDLDFHNTDTE